MSVECLRREKLAMGTLFALVPRSKKNWWRDRDKKGARDWDRNENEGTWVEGKEGENA